MPRSSHADACPEPLAGWSHRIADVPERGLETGRTANAGELQALAAALDIAACRALKAHYVIRPIGSGRYRVSGELEAEVTQTCIVSLEPVEAAISESFDEEYWPVEQIPSPGQGAESEEREALSHSAPELIEHGVIAMGHLVYEQLATALDPYPRAPGADFAWSDATAGRDTPGQAENPFAALAALKDKDKGGS